MEILNFEDLLLFQNQSLKLKTGRYAPCLTCDFLHFYRLDSSYSLSDLKNFLLRGKAVRPLVGIPNRESHGRTVSLTIKPWGLAGLRFLYQFSTFNEKNEENLSIRSLNFLKMYHRIPLLLALRLSVPQFQIPLEGLRFVKTLVTFRFIYVTDPLVQNVTNIVCLVDPHHSIFLTITPCSPC